MTALPPRKEGRNRSYGASRVQQTALSEIKHIVWPPCNKLSSAAIFVLMWSSGAIFVKAGLRYAGPFQFLSYRAMLAALLLWTICFVWREKNCRTPVLMRNIIAALLLQVGYQSGFFLALDHGVTPGLLAIILALQPILTGVIEPRGATRRAWVGLVLGFAGVAITVGSIGEGGAILGATWALAALTSLTVGTIVQHRWGGSGDLLRDMAFQYSVSAPVLVGIAWITRGGAVTWVWPFIISLSWMVLVVSIGATFLLYMMLKQGSALSVSALFYCIPPVTALLDYAVYGDLLSPLQCAGMGLVVFGVVLILRAVPGGRIQNSW